MGDYTGGVWEVRHEAVRLIHFGMNNIQNGRNKRLESLLRVMSQANADLGVFQETNVTKDIYTWELSGYRVVDLEAPSSHSGSVTLFFCTVDHFSVEALHFYGSNVIIFQLASGDQCWYM